jgi:hypothetical protein
MREPDLRLLRWALAAAITGTGCGAASIILDFGWAATRSGGMLTAAHCLTWCTSACLAAVVAIGVVLRRRVRRLTAAQGQTPRSGTSYPLSMLNAVQSAGSVSRPPASGRFHPSRWYRNAV